MRTYLTTKELAELLRIKERKVYDLAASGAVPCSRATGKLLFPREAIEAWLTAHSSGPRPASFEAPSSLPQPWPRAGRPIVILGSYDPLLEWALRESLCHCALFLDGSLDGLERFARGEGIATGLHIADEDEEKGAELSPISESGWNVAAVRMRLAKEPVVLVEWAWRERGLILGTKLADRVASLADLAGLRVVPRQAEAGSQRLWERVLAEAGGAAEEIAYTAPVRAEADAALAVAEGKADVAFGLRALADQYRLAFIPVLRERFDLLVDRYAWFEPPWQKFVEFCRTQQFVARAKEMHGYDVSGQFRVHFNGGG